MQKTQNSNAWLNKGGTALLSSARQGNADIVALLLDSKADPNLKDDSGLTPARAAIELSSALQRKRVLSLLLDHGADTENRDSEGKTLLMRATGAQGQTNRRTVAGPQSRPECQSRTSIRKNTALHYAVFSISSADAPEVSPGIVEALLAGGAIPNLQNTEGKTPAQLPSSESSQIG